MSESMMLTIGTEMGYEPAKVQLIKDLVAKDTTDDELALFLYTAQRTGLDPLARQIYCIKRWNGALGRMVATPQTSIDGYRLIADRTGSYAPGRATAYEYVDGGGLLSATAYVLKCVQGTWHEVAATAFWDEYVAKDKSGKPTTMWREKPHIMLGKCAESLALRRAFPAELSGLYTQEETGNFPDASVDVTPQPAQASVADDVHASAAAELGELRMRLAEQGGRPRELSRKQVQTMSVYELHQEIERTNMALTLIGQDVLDAGGVA